MSQLHRVPNLGNSQINGKYRKQTLENKIYYEKAHRNGPKQAQAPQYPHCMGMSEGGG